MWLLRARWTAVIDFNLIDSFSMVENTPQPEWTQHTRSFCCPDIVIEAMECRRLAINLPCVVVAVIFAMVLLRRKVIHPFCGQFARLYKQHKLVKKVVWPQEAKNEWILISALHLLTRVAKITKTTVYDITSAGPLPSTTQTFPSLIPSPHPPF